MSCSDSSLPTDERNLVVKAALGFFERAGVGRGVRIHLDKRLPHQAGLGGGSANAAVTLSALNELLGEPLQATDLHEIAAGLEWFTGREVFDPTVYYFQEIPAIIEPLTVAAVALGAVLIAVMASVLPALRAARLHPVEALRYE